ncbi:hypothetical protein HDV02_002883 [Globomyces sp. JEL0801]|nr:hypothetical protein HDV02_002883 [Globomyces sp. JEL0801]
MSTKSVDIETEVEMNKEEKLSWLNSYLIKASTKNEWNDSEIPPIVNQVIQGSKDLNIYPYALFYKVQSDYYNLSLGKRKLLLDAPSTHHLCKSVLFENTKWKSRKFPNHDNSDFSNQDYIDDYLNWDYPRYTLVLVQYTDKINTKKFNQYMRNLSKLSSKQINMRVTSEEPHVMFLGAGDPDWKVSIPVEELKMALNAVVVDLAE